MINHWYAASEKRQRLQRLPCRDTGDVSLVRKPESQLAMNAFLEPTPILLAPVDESGTPSVGGISSRRCPEKPKPTPVPATGSSRNESAKLASYPSKDSQIPLRPPACERPRPRLPHTKHSSIRHRPQLGETAKGWENTYRIAIVATTHSRRLPNRFVQRLN